MIHEVRNKFAISSHQVWMPGCYESKRAANYAFRFSDRELRTLQNMANERNGGYDGVITMNDLKEYRKNNKVKVL